MANRVLLGNNYIGDESGLYVSKPGYDVVSEETGHLLLNSDDGFFQPLKSGRAVVPPASGITLGSEGVANVYTGVISPHYDNTPLMVSWHVIVESANVHPIYSGSVFGGPFSYNGPIEAVSNFSAIATQFMDDVNQWNPDVEAQNRVIPQIGLSCSSYANTQTSPASIDIQFRNGSTVNTQLVFWTIYRERGMPE
jgi:hypothetical protein